MPLNGNLTQYFFHKIIEKFGKPDIYLFASRINKQLGRCVSWQSELDAVAINAFSIIYYNGYICFISPSSLIIGQVMSKLKRNKTGRDSGTRLANIIPAPLGDQYDETYTSVFCTVSEKFDVSTQDRRNTSITQKTKVNGSKGNATTVKTLEVSLQQFR